MKIGTICALIAGTLIVAIGVSSAITFSIRDSFVASEGLQGEQGIQGEIGLTGQRGYKGDVGSRGLIGEVGERGIRGIRGIQGIKGTQGIQGIQGEIPEGEWQQYCFVSGKLLEWTDTCTVAETVSFWIK